MPAFILDAGDLVLIMGICIVIGMLWATRYTIVAALHMLDVSILGSRPLHGPITRVENAIVGILNDAISGSERALAKLWYGLVWSFEELWKGLKELSTALTSTFRTLWRVQIPLLIAAATREITNLIGDVPRAYKSISAWITGEAALIATRVHNLAISIPGSISDATSEFYNLHVRPLEAKLAGVESLVYGIEKSLRHEFTIAVNDAEALARHGIADLRTAEETAIAAARSAETLTAEQLRNLLDSVDWTNLAAIMAAFPVLAALVGTIAVESGLDSNECRRKVKGICGTNPAAWENLLTGLIAGLAMLNLPEMVKLSIGIFHELSDDVVSYIGEGR